MLKNLICISSFDSGLLETNLLRYNFYYRRTLNKSTNKKSLSIIDYADYFIRILLKLT